MIEITQICDSFTKGKICRNILSDLPLWFGIPESTDEYCRNVELYDFYSVIYEKETIGFISVKMNNEYVAELYVLGILKNYHRKGFGKVTLNYIFEKLKDKKIRYVEVKTLDETKESDEYMKTRRFYQKLGFIPIDVLNNEWGINNPCLIMLKEL